MSDDTPTQRFDQPVGGSAPVPPDGEEKKSRGLLIALIAIGAVLLIAIIVILILLLGRNSGTNTSATGSPSPSVTTPSPSPSTTPSASPSPTPSVSASHTSAPPPPPPPNPNAQIASYTIGPSKVDCSSGAPAGSADLSIHWSSINGKNAYFGVGDAAKSDAQLNGMGWTLPPSGTQHDFPSGYDPYEYQCGNASQTYTITIVGTNGSKVSKTVTVSRK